MIEMARYRKKPVTIEARRMPRWDEAPSALRFAEQCEALALWCGGVARIMDQAEEDGVMEGIYIPTLEGEMRADPGDWIICGVQGEFYPCKPDIFAATYEPADGDRP
jgi:hypothetical protein